MKISLLSLQLLLLSMNLSTQSCPTIKARNAHQYIGKEVIVEGRLCSYGNSSYLQFASLYLGPDTSHKQLEVLIQGGNYYKGKIWIGNYVGKEVRIRGIVKKDKGVYLDATDTLKLKQ
jgi:hypothetical protein